MKKTLIQHIVLFGFVIILFGCQSKENHTHADGSSHGEDEQPVHEHTASNTDIISVTQQQFEASNFEVSPLEMKPFNNTLMANGRIHLPEKNKAIASSLIGGTVNNIDLIHGQWVKKGQHLLTVTNPDLLNLQLEYLELQGRMTFLQTEAHRLKQLSEENITANKNFLKADSELNIAKSKKAALTAKLILIGIDPQNISNNSLITQLPLATPISGYITKISVLQGSFLPATAPAIEISNTNHLHAELKVLERDIPLLKREQNIDFTIQGFTDKVLKATIHQIENEIDQNRMINIHCHIESNEGVRLIPGMSIRGEIDVDVVQSLALPTEAILTTDNKKYVLRQVENQALNYEVIEVQIGREENGYAQVLNPESFHSSAIFLTKGAYLVYAPDEEGVAKGHSH